MLAARNLVKGFGERVVVDGVTLHLRRGEAVALLGPNGAGKTTLFRLLTGVETPDAGDILLDGADITTMPLYERARRGLSYLPQEPSLFRGLTVEQNILVVLEARELDRAKRARSLETLLTAFNIKAIRASSASNLSGGERRRTEIARALAAQPSFILLDEPFAGVDPIATGEVGDLVRLLTTTGVGVLITDHNVREALAIVERGYIIESGRLFAAGTVHDIVNNPDVRRVYLDKDFKL